MPKDFPIQDALDVQLACERSDSNAEFNVLVNDTLVPVTRITLSDDKPQLVTAHLSTAYHMDPLRQALERIAKIEPTVLDVTASDLDDIGDELLDDVLTAVNIAREALGQSALVRDDYVASEDGDDGEEDQ